MIIYLTNIIKQMSYNRIKFCISNIIYNLNNIDG